MTRNQQTTAPDLDAALRHFDLRGALERLLAASTGPAGSADLDDAQEYAAGVLADCVSADRPKATVPPAPDLVAELASALRDLEEAVQRHFDREHDGDDDTFYPQAAIVKARSALTKATATRNA